MTNKIIVAVFLALFLAVSGFIINSGSNVKNLIVGDTYTFLSSESIDVVLSGSVKNPGKHTVESGLRLYELLALCGGITDDASLETVNMDSIITSSGIYSYPKPKKIQLWQKKNILLQESATLIQQAKKNFLH